MHVKKSGKIAFLFNSRNNYNLFEDIFFKYTDPDLSDYYIFNVDIDSDPDHRARWQTKLMPRDIIHIPSNINEDPNIVSACRTMEMCIDYIDKHSLDVEWIIWFSHDCYLIGSDFMQRLEQKLEENSRFKEEVGCIGFCDYNTVQVGSPVYGRGMLIDGFDKYSPVARCYENLPEEYKNSDYFVVEAPWDNGAMFNVSLYKKHIVPDYEFKLYNWMDDISAQFGLLGIASITIPSLEMADLFREKPQYGIARSIKGFSEFHAETYRSAKKQPEHWRAKYFYGRPPEPFRDDFQMAKRKYAGSVQEKIISWHIDDGPKTLDDLK